MGLESGGGRDGPHLSTAYRLTAGGANGIQIEQSRQARSRHWRAIADAVADVYGPKLGTTSSTRIQRGCTQRSS